uniref:Uncharacterized protein n=1 Tax=Tetranychus urticae TaxID=32264 RepID=T1KCY4_TETUR
MIFVESIYAANHCTDPSTYKCEDGYKPTYEQVVNSLGARCDGETCDDLIKEDSDYCEAAEKFCSAGAFVRNSPVYSFNGTTGVRRCDSKERILTSPVVQITNVKTSCADGEQIHSASLQQFCFDFARKQYDQKSKSAEFKKCDFVKKGNTAEQIKDRGDAFCEYVLLYCNSKQT